jgi:hypothetical protein
MGNTAQRDGGNEENVTNKFAQELRSNAIKLPAETPRAARPIPRTKTVSTWNIGHKYDINTIEDHDPGPPAFARKWIEWLKTATRGPVACLRGISFAGSVGLHQAVMNFARRSSTQDTVKMKEAT